MKAIGKRYSKTVPPDDCVYVTVCAGCGKDVFGWTQQLANEAWRTHECETPKRKPKSK
jgi:hypothetical protein